MKTPKDTVETEEEAIERRTLTAYGRGEITRELYYGMGSIKEVLDAYMEGKMDTETYHKILGCERQ